MGRREREELMELNSHLDSQIRDLQTQRIAYEREIIQSEALAKELKAKSVECALHLDLRAANLAESAKAFVSQFGGRGAAPKVAPSAVERSERKLELKLLTQVRKFDTRHVKSLLC